MAEDKTGTGENITKEKLLSLIDTMTDEEKGAFKQKLNMVDDKSLQRAKEFSKISEQHLETLKDTALILNDIEAAKAADLALTERRLMKEVEGLGTTDAMQKQIEESMEKFIKKAKEGGDITESLTGLREKGLDIDEEELENIAKKIKFDNDLLEGQKKYGKAQKKVLNNIAAAIGMTKEYKDTFLGSLVEISKGLGSKDINERNKALLALQANFVKVFNLQNAALAVFSKIYSNSSKMFKDFDKGQASLAKATAQGREFNDVLYDVGQGALFSGVSMSDAAQAIGTLVNQTSNFTSLNKATQTEIATTVAKMEKLGVSASDSAAIFQNFNQGLGITAKESISMQRDLAMAGASIGISASKITKDFNASLSTLMVYGRESIDVFKGIAAAAKAAGVETSTLLGIASKFDTFAGAAEGAGKLNALLGTQLSTTEMLMATEDERIRMLVQSVQSQGVAFQDMDRFTQKAIANAAGITDMAEANRIFGMSLDAYDENERKLKASANAQEAFDDAVAKTVPVMEKFKLLGASIVFAMEPFFETISSAAEGLTTFFESMTPEGREKLGTIMTILAGAALLIPIFKVGGALLSGLGALGSVVLPAMGVGGGLASAGIAATGKASTSAAPGVAAFAGSLAAVTIQIVAIVGAVGLAIGAIAMLVEAFGASEFDVQTAEAEAKLKGFEARTAEAAASIVNGPHEAALASISAIVGEMTKLSQDVKVSSTIENLALITAGKATAMTGERVSASQTNVMTNVQNSFEGLMVKVKIGEREFDAYMEDSFMPKAHGV